MLQYTTTLQTYIYFIYKGTEYNCNVEQKEKIGIHIYIVSIGKTYDSLNTSIYQISF